MVRIFLVILFLSLSLEAAFAKPFTPEQNKDISEHLEKERESKQVLHLLKNYGTSLSECYDQYDNELNKIKGIKDNEAQLNGWNRLFISRKPLTNAKKCYIDLYHQITAQFYSKKSAEMNQLFDEYIKTTEKSYLALFFDLDICPEMCGQTGKFQAAQSTNEAISNFIFETLKNIGLKYDYQ